MGLPDYERELLVKEYREKYVKRMFDDETRNHEVCLEQGFWMSRTEVTQRAWRAVEDDKRVFCNPGDGRPVNFVTWEEVKTFIEVLNTRNKESGVAFRLPTEAEWEYAARAGTTTPYHTGATLTSEQANFCGTYPFNGGKIGPYLQSSSPVASYPANAFGLFDMHGNIEEWCEDLYTSPNPQPDATNDAIGLRVVKGGRYTDHGMHLRSAARRGYGPLYANCEVGFRLVRSK